ncbi:STAS domain-containing protein [Streptomyces sp. SID14478]|uniref:STAS domain-containing protein n=1 Tax=Streptomyces sp. SID14478 TaxID=2706073 RepID=UPI0013DAA3A6|nr:STAS domain-containing protein [Streptomyces sp. SID14478]NEB76043.1 STAS domain-containing protein [Streptomyces sp. SID14478]
MTTQLLLTASQLPDGTHWLTAAGEIDMTNAERLDRALADLSGRVVVDLGSVSYLDSAGLNVLFSYAERLELIVPELLATVVEVSGLTELAAVRGPEGSPSVNGRPEGRESGQADVSP